MPTRGLLVAVMGVDGSGKSSVILGLQDQLSQSVPDLRVLQGNNKACVVEKIVNHAKPPHPFWVSFPKLICRAGQWLWKYIFYCLPCLKNGGLILSDRFYFDDLMVDPLKYRYQGPKGFLRFIRNLLPGPDVYILLDAPEDVLYSRKQETSFEEVMRLRKAYRQFIATQPRGHVVDASTPLADVTEQTRQILADHYSVI